MQLSSTGFHPKDRELYQFMDEELLIAGCRRGDPSARKELYALYAPAMMSVCMRYVGNRETARDLLQDGFIKVFTKIRTYAATGAFRGWVRRIFVTTALEYLRREQLHPGVNVEEYEEALEAADYSALDRLSADELLACVARLPAGYRTIFNLYAIEGYSHGEIARMLHIREVTSRTQFIRARNLLQKNVQSLIGRENAGQRRTY